MVATDNEVVETMAEALQTYDRIGHDRDLQRDVLVAFVARQTEADPALLTKLKGFTEEFAKELNSADTEDEDDDYEGDDEDDDYEGDDEDDDYADDEEDDEEDDDYVDDDADDDEEDNLANLYAYKFRHDAPS